MLLIKVFNAIAYCRHPFPKITTSLLQLFPFNFAHVSQVIQELLVQANLYIINFFLMLHENVF